MGYIRQINMWDILDRLIYGIYWTDIYVGYIRQINM